MLLEVTIHTRQMVDEAKLDFRETVELLIRSQSEFRKWIDARPEPGFDFVLDTGGPQQIRAVWTSWDLVGGRWAVHVIAPAVVLGAVPASSWSAHCDLSVVLDAIGLVMSLTIGGNTRHSGYVASCMSCSLFSTWCGSCEAVLHLALPFGTGSLVRVDDGDSKDCQKAKARVARRRWLFVLMLLSLNGDLDWGGPRGNFDVVVGVIWRGQIVD